MHNKKKRILLLMIIMLVLIAITQKPSFAAGGSAKASIGKSNLNIGETTSLTVTVTNAAIFYNVTSSDSNVIKLSETSGDIDGGYGTSNTATHTLTAVGAGTATITVKSSTATAYDESKFSLNETFTITVNKPAEPEQPKSDASLKSITVGSNVYQNPKTDITVKVDSSVNSINVSAVATDSNAKITGLGSKELKTGTNNVNITVTNPDGAKKDYIIRINKLADTSNITPNVQEENKPQAQQIDEPDENTENPEEPEVLELKYLMVQDVELYPEFTPEIFNYRTEVASNVDKLDIVATANDEQAIVEITGNEDFKEGTNEVIIKVSKEGKDTVEYKIEVTKKTAELLIGKEETDETGGAGTISNGDKIKKIAIGFIAGIAIISLILVIWKIKDGSDMASRARRVADRRHSFDDFD